MNKFLEEMIFSNSTKFNNCLETGAGSHSYLSVFHDRFNFNLTLLDKSRLGLNKLNISNLSKVNVINEDACLYKKDDSFDLILDSHLYHCITNDLDRRKYLSNVFINLSPGGSFIVETMVSHSNLSFDFDLFFDPKTGVLTYNDQKIRMIKSSKEVEDEFLNAGFKITYFRCFEDMKLIAHPLKDEATPFDPDILRIICQKPY